MEKLFLLSSPEFNKQREIAICNIVLQSVEQRSLNHSSMPFTCDTNLFTQAGLSMKDIAYIIYKVRIGLLIPFSYDLLLDLHKDSTIGDLAGSIVKGMVKAIQYN